MRISMLVALLAALVSPGALRSEEGMWTFDNLPLKQMQATYGFAPDQAWLDHLRLSVVRFPGATGSFISQDGLVITNHHVGRGWTQRVSDKDHDYVKHGYVAQTRAQELKVPGLELYTLMTMDNVTDRVNQAVKPGMPEKEALKAREQVLETIKDEMQKKSGLRCEEVSLYQGGEWWIYSYRIHRDVRLVMAPETQLGAFGGDPDNFTYPRHGLDMTFFRVYENDKPYTPPHYLRWAKAGLKAGDLTLVTGHPGGTDRQMTYAQMVFARDIGLPQTLETLTSRKAMYQAYGQRSPEHARQVNDRIFGIENGYKALAGELRGLKNSEAMARIEAAEKAFQAKVASDPKLNASAGASWQKIEKAVQTSRRFSKESRFVGTCGSGLLANALRILRITDEELKPANLRLPEYSEASLPEAKRRLTVPAPYFPELELHQFIHGLKEAATGLGANHPFVKAMLGGKTPEEVAKAAVEGSKLQDPNLRKQLLEGGKKAVDASQDPMILLARKLDPMGRKLRKQLEDEVASVTSEHSARIAKARFQVYGKSVYPDATFTLRLTYGAVEGYPANGTFMQPFTTFAGLYDRAWGQGPEAFNGAWALPQRWLERRDKLDLSTPLNFVHTVDTIGGNSGSPVVNKAGEFTGILHDGNTEGLSGNYYFEPKVNRSISLDARAIVESLGKIYDANDLVKEIKGE